MKKLAGIIFISLFIFTSFMLPQSLPLPADKNIVLGMLYKGKDTYIQKNQKPEKRAELRIAVNAGSMLEDYNQQGLAHLLNIWLLTEQRTSGNRNWWITLRIWE